MVNGKQYEDVGMSDDFVNYFLSDILNSPLTDILIVYCRNDQREKAIAPTDRIFEIIPPEEWNMSKYTCDTKQVRNATLQMGALVKRIFGNNESIQLL